MEATGIQEFEFVAVKEEPVENLEDKELCAAQEFEFVEVKQEKLEDPADEELTAAQVLIPLEVPPCSIKLEHKDCEFQPTASPDVPSTDCREQVTCKLDSEDCGQPSNASSTHEEPYTAPGVRRLGPKELKRENFTCDICRSVFLSKYNIIHHVFTHIDGVSPPAQICRQCGDVLCSTGHLERHKRCAHKGEDQHVCDVCGRAFKKSDSLKRHIRTHTGERPYSCDVCGKSFSVSYTLSQHKYTHTGEEPYVCKLCGKSFKWNSHLQQHIRTHTDERPYGCDICGKAFRVSTTLKRHRRIHTGEQPYACDYCGRSFTQSGDLKIHIRTHTGERPYVCDVCGKAFSQSSILHMHKRTHLQDQSSVEERR